MCFSMGKYMSAECVSYVLFIHLVLMTTLFIYLHYEDGKVYLEKHSMPAFLRYLSKTRRTEDAVVEDHTNDDDMEFTHYSKDEKDSNNKESPSPYGDETELLMYGNFSAVNSQKVIETDKDSEVQELLHPAGNMVDGQSEQENPPQEPLSQNPVEVDAVEIPASENAEVVGEVQPEQTEVPASGEVKKESSNKGVEKVTKPIIETFFEYHEDPLLTSDGFPSLYAAYGESGISSGLTFDNDTFYLNNKQIRIMGGSIHYFRVHPLYWRDRLKKLRAAGLNTVTTYVPWNMHEPIKGHYWFQDYFVNLKQFMIMAKEEDLLVILRPGPYICAELEFGGFPSWLLRNGNMQLRSLNTSFFLPAKRYLRQVVKLVSDLQWSPANGAQPLIAVQIDNEYPIPSDNAIEAKRYIKTLKTSMEEDGLTDVLYIVTNPSKYIYGKSLVPGVLQAVSFGNLPYQRLKHVKAVQPQAPLLVMEFWTGWFDSWLRPHHTSNLTIFEEDLDTLLRNDVSFNLYMFHGGTTYGFMSGAALKRDGESKMAVTSSYDFNGLLTESGDYTAKYKAVRKLIEKYPKGPQVTRPAPPPSIPKKAYPVGIVKQYIPFEDLVKKAPVSILSEHPVNMEDLQIAWGSGQSEGFILYRKTDVKIGPMSTLKIKGVVRDILYLMVDGQLITKPFTMRNDSQRMLYLRDPEIFVNGDDGLHQIDLLVENMGRLSVGPMNTERKGILGQVFLDDQLLTNWTIYPLHFSNYFIHRLSGWKTFTSKENITNPCIYRAVLRVEGPPADTFIGLPSSETIWVKGQIFVNSFNLGRYWNLGPTKNSYIPAPLLHEGENMIVIFELFRGGRYIYFQDRPLLS